LHICYNFQISFNRSGIFVATREVPWALNKPNMRLWPDLRLGTGSGRSHRPDDSLGGFKSRFEAAKEGRE